MPAETEDVQITVDHLIEVLATLPTAAPTIEELGVALGFGGDPLQDLLQEAEILGQIAVWEDGPEGFSVMLTPIAADGAKLRLEEVEGGVGRFLFRWVPSCERPRPDKIQSQARMTAASVLAGEDGDDYLDTLQDPAAPDPHESAEFAETQVANIDARQRGTKAPKVEPALRPVHLVGLRPAWPGPGAEGPCVGCGGRYLDLLEVCLRCNRAGLDHLLPPISKKLLRAMADQRERDEALAGGTETPKVAKEASGGSRATRRGAKAKDGGREARKAKTGA